MWLLRNAPTSLVSTYAYVNPVIAVFLGWLFLNEALSGRTLAAAAIIVAGVAMIISTGRLSSAGEAVPPPPSETPRGA